jgi:hypothetical protein
MLENARAMCNCIKTQGTVLDEGQSRFANENVKVVEEKKSNCSLGKRRNQCLYISKILSRVLNGTTLGSEQKRSAVS